MLLKAMSFATIGVINAVVDASVFFLAYAALGSLTPFVEVLRQIAERCACGGVATMRLVIANIVAWMVAVSGSYVMNSYITFASESGRRLRWRAYLAFAVSGVAGLITNTGVLIVAAQVMPVWAAKGLAIFASFAVNFLLSHFVVFRPRPGHDR